MAQVTPQKPAEIKNANAYLIDYAAKIDATLSILSVIDQNITKSVKSFANSDKKDPFYSLMRILHKYESSIQAISKTIHEIPNSNQVSAVQVSNVLDQFPHYLETILD